MAINVNVNTTNVEITSIDTINEGEYGINDCVFTFSNEYNNLIKRAVFSSGTYDETYVVELVSNTCKVPEGILMLHGDVVIGVYAYSIENNELQLRYSPAPTRFFVEKGSYIQDASHYIPAQPIGDLIDEYNRNAAQKLLEFNENANLKTQEFDDNVTEKINEYNSNTVNKINQYNQNANEKTAEFNQNAVNKTSAFDDNAQNKTTDFNTNATNKTNDFDDNAQNKTNALNQIAEGIEDMTTAIQFATFRIDDNMGLYILQADRLINTNFNFNPETGGLEVMIVNE